MRLVVALAGLILAGCASGPSLSGVMTGCGYDTKPFTEAWPCVRQGMAHTSGEADLKAVYIANGDLAAQQVAAGKLTDAEARLAMAELRQRLNTAARTRDANPVADAVVLGSIMNRPPVGSTSAPAIGTPSVPVQCYRFGNMVQCY